MKRKPTKLEEWVDGITQVAYPCEMCKFIDKNGETHFQNTEICKGCCWYYPSQFKEKK